MAGAPRFRALETLLSRATSLLPDSSPKGYEQGLFALFDIGQTDADLPVAAVTRMLDMGVIDNDWWLRADPVHLSVDRDRLILVDAQKLDITQNEANRLIADVMEVFAADGWLLKAPHPARWYLKALRQPGVTTTPLSQVVGRDIHSFLPRGAEDKSWHTILNEIQILLHTAGVNVEREQGGKLPINSLWFWGGGRLPRIKPVSWTQVWSDEPVTQSLAKLSGTPVDKLPRVYAAWRERAGEGGEHLVVFEEIHAAVLYDDVDRWNASVQKIEKDWIEPLLRDLKSGAIDRLTLYTENGPGFSIESRHARRWWRLRRPLASYRTEPD